MKKDKIIQIVLYFESPSLGGLSENGNLYRFDWERERWILVARSPFLEEEPTK